MVTFLVDASTAVKKDNALLVMEAMKMEHTIRAPANGTVTEFYFQPGDLVDGGANLVAFEAAEQTSNAKNRIVIASTARQSTMD